MKSLNDAKQKLLNHHPRASHLRSLPFRMSLSMMSLSVLVSLVSIALSFVVSCVLFYSLPIQKPNFLKSDHICIL